ncbi:hypothetical protein MtrunA17_Chr1g0157631 [Medicago truncatula]|uniref:Uncharacterized protein n=1 Tax=Medicago truncatula TaxID=3880 RepID=A0A396JKI9_MEDTR|nr:hypothetical protein MtrunA17_Chr1g0157631 [Medicago truncatula]
MSQNLKSPNPDDKETRLERRWKRREAMNDSLKHNHVASATKTPAEICENTTILIDESDHTIDDDTNEDCEILLGECTGVNDEVEADYKSLLAKYSPVIETDMLVIILMVRKLMKWMQMQITDPFCERSRCCQLTEALVKGV